MLTEVLLNCPDFPLLKAAYIKICTQTFISSIKVSRNVASEEWMGAAHFSSKWLGVDLSNTLVFVQGRGVKIRERRYFWENFLDLFFKCHSFFSWGNVHAVLLGSTPCHPEIKVWLGLVSSQMAVGLLAGSIQGMGPCWRAGQSCPHRFHLWLHEVAQEWQCVTALGFWVHNADAQKSLGIMMKF